MSDDSADHDRPLSRAAMLAEQLTPPSWRLGTWEELWVAAYDCRRPLLIDAPRLWGAMQDADRVLARVGAKPEVWCFKQVVRLDQRPRPGERPRKVCAVIAGNYQQLMLLSSMAATVAYQPVYQLALIELLRRDRRAAGVIEWLVKEYLLTATSEDLSPSCDGAEAAARSLAESGVSRK
jgi:hypothetical protein